MNAPDVAAVLDRVREGSLSVEDAVAQVRGWSGRAGRMPDATIDHDRARRCGFPEVVYAPGKTAEQVARIARELHGRNDHVLISRADAGQTDAVRAAFAGQPVEVGPRCGSIIVGDPPAPDPGAPAIPIVAAGTADQPVAEEAAMTCAALGHAARSIMDVGVAGVHRLMDRLDELAGCRVIVCIAGMEGALPSVVGGLVDVPVIAVPTSVGYGAAFDGLAALLGMLTSCASGVTVVNIDNGFGAAYSACLINRLPG